MGVHSLRVKSTLITVMGIVACLVSFGFVSYVTVGREANASSVEKMHLLSENAADELDKYLDSIEQSVEMCSHLSIASLDSVALVECGAKLAPEARSAEQTARLDAMMSEYSTQTQQTFDSVASYTNGIITYYFCINPDVSVKEHGFFYSKMGKVGFEEREPLDARELDEKDLQHTTWYYTPISRGIPSWVGPYTAHFLGEVYCVSYLAPIYKAGILIGVMGMDILFDTLLEHVKSLEVYDTGYACLLDTDGRVLYDPALEMGAKPSFTEQVFGPKGVVEETSGNAVIRYRYNDREWQLAYSTLSNGMRLVVCAPVGEVIASWLHLISIMPAVVLLILIIFAIIAFMAMRAVSAPLQQLTVAAHKLSDGDYDVELSYDRQDEVGELTSAIRGLRDHLQIYIIDLNSQEYIDETTGVKNRRALNIYCARLDDTIGHEDEREQLQFAFVRLEIIELDLLRAAHGESAADECIKVTCQFICMVYSASPVFHLGAGRFVVLLQQADYANRDEKMLDFQVRSKRQNMRTEDPWKKIQVRIGMSTFRREQDRSSEIVLARAKGRLK